MRNSWRYVLAFALLAVAFATRAPFLGRHIWNLDEGSTFTMAQIVREGGVLYRDAADNRTPLVPYLKAAIFAVAGDWNATAVHIVIALALGGAAIGLWQLCRRLGDERTGLVAAGLFVLLSFALIGVHESQAAHTEWFQIFFSVPAFLLFARATTRPTLPRGLAIGALFGAAALCKQPGLLDLGVTLVIAALLAAARGAPRRAFLGLIAGELIGVAAVLAATFAYFAAHGALADFVMYAWTYNTRFYVPEVPLLERWSFGAMSFDYAWQLSPPLLIIGLAGALTLAWRALTSVPRAATGAVPVPVLGWLILGWSASGIVSTMLSGRSFSHYVIGAVPGLSLACAWALVRAGEWAAGRTVLHRAAVALACAGALGFAGARIAQQLRHVSPHDDFPAGDRVAIQHLSRPQDRIFVWGYIPEVHFQTERLPNTRFVYSVFLTGMIPWTNVDSLVDTTYAVVPGSWEKFWSDFRRTPPALIVDTGGQRSWGKYPLEERTELWAEIQRNYLVVRGVAPRELTYRYFLRQSAPAAASAPESEPAGLTRAPAPLPLEFALSSGTTVFGEVSFALPADATEVRIAPSGSAARVSSLPPLTALGDTVRIGALFAADELRDTVQVVVRTASGGRLEGTLDLAREVANRRLGRRAGPALAFGPRAYPPLEAVGLNGAFTMLNAKHWLAHAPSTLMYERPPALSQLVLEYGIDPGAWTDPTHAQTGGADLVVEFEPKGGSAKRLFVRRLHPAGRDIDQGTQRETIAVPGTEPGRFILRFLPGSASDASFDWTYWQSVRGLAAGPVIALGEDFLPPREQSAAAGKMTPLEGERWLAHAPARAVYEIPASLAEFTFGFGLLDNAYEDGPQGKTDGVTARVTARRADGTEQTLFERHLDPAKTAADRGPQTATVPLPPRDFRTLTVSLEPGPRGNSAFDWTYLENFRALTHGPKLELGDGRFLAAARSDVNRDGPMIVDTVHGTYGAHAPAEVDYERPANLAAVSFSYGLFEPAYFDEQGRPRSDGIEAVVELIDAGGRATELFRRELTPAARPADRGRQRSRVELPPGLPGRLRFRITPGPSGSNAFDWAYFIDFRGELVP